jgi:hypothetical protein
MVMQPTLDSAWITLRDQLVAAGGIANGTAVLLPCANRAVAITPGTIAGYSCVIVIASIGRAVDCDMERALLLANELEVGSMIVASHMLALRHAVPVADASLAGIFNVANVLADLAQRVSPVLLRRSPARSKGIASAFAHVAE